MRASDRKEELDHSSSSYHTSLQSSAADSKAFRQIVICGHGGDGCQLLPSQPGLCKWHSARNLLPPVISRLSELRTGNSYAMTLWHISNRILVISFIAPNLNLFMSLRYPPAQPESRRSNEEHIRQGGSRFGNTRAKGRANVFQGNLWFNFSGPSSKSASNATSTSQKFHAHTTKALQRRLDLISRATLRMLRSSPSERSSHEAACTTRYTCNSPALLQTTALRCSRCGG